MDSSYCFEISSGHDILTPECESYILEQYLNTLKSHRVIAKSCVKDLQPLFSSANVCLNTNSSTGKLNGLIIIEAIVEECSSHAFAQFIPSSLQQLTSLVKVVNTGGIYFPKLCGILSGIVSNAQHYPDVSRQLTSSASNLAVSLIACVKANPVVAESAMNCLTSLQRFYFGAVGPVVKQIESFLIENLHPWNNVISDPSLAKSFALLPKAGGGGKDGVLHREAWESLTLKTVATLDSLLKLIHDVVPSNRATFDVQEKPLFDLPRPQESTDLMRKVFFYSAQFNRLSKCAARLLLSEFSQPKLIHPSVFVELLNKAVKTFPLSTVVKGKDVESRIVSSVLPTIISSTLRLTRSLILVGRSDLILNVPDFLNAITNIVRECRQCTDIGSGLVPFPDVRLELYKFVSTLCSTLGANSGVEFIGQTLVPLLVSDFLPPKSGVKLVASRGKNSSKKKGEGRTGEAEFGLGQKGRSSSDSLEKLAEASLICLASTVKAGGVFLSKSLHKNLQCILFGLCNDAQLSKDSKSSALTVYHSGKVRCALYRVVLELILGSHPTCRPPVQHVIKVFQRGLMRHEESDSRVLEACRDGLAVCELLAHPRSATLELELPLEDQEIADVKADAMKVHIVYIDGGAGDALREDERVLHQESQDPQLTENGDASSVQEIPELKEVSRGPDFTQEPGFNLLSSRSKDLPKRKLNETSTEEEVDYAECEKLMNDVNSFDNRPPITIPDEVAHRAEQVKKPRLDEKIHEPLKDREEGIDLETMLSSFVNKTNDEEC